MQEIKMSELKRRTLSKSLLWRFIGIIWTWIGAYLILLFVPDPYRTAAWMATLIVIYHHSTRMIMYYFYERIWASVNWGRININGKDTLAMSFHDKAIWVLATVVIIAIIFILLIFITPMMPK